MTEREPNMSPALETGDDAALRIYQERFDSLSAAVLALDYEKIFEAYNLPLQLRTLTSEMVIESEEDLREGYAGYVEGLTSQGLTDLLWLASTARWLSPDYIEGFHVSHLLRNATPLVPPFQNRAVLRCVDGVWKLDELDSHVMNTRWPITLPRAAGATPLPDHSFSFPAGDARSTATDPLAVYSAFLEAYSALNMAHDFDGWAAMHLFPHMVHTDQVDKTIKEPGGLRGFFDMMSAIIVENGCDRFERKASRAEFLSANKICGYHTGTLYRGAQIVLGPIKSRFILHRIGPQWLLRSATNAVANHDFPYHRPKVSDALVGLNEISKRRQT